MPHFLIVIAGGHERHDMMADVEREAYYSQWGTFLDRLTHDGVLIDGHPLERSGCRLTRVDGVSHDWELEPATSIGGYLVVSANDLEDATMRVRQCPVFSVGGYVEIRPIEPMPERHDVNDQSGQATLAP